MISCRSTIITLVDSPLGPLAGNSTSQSLPYPRNHRYNVSLLAPYNPPTPHKTSVEKRLTMNRETVTSHYARERPASSAGLSMAMGNSSDYSWPPPQEPLYKPRSIYSNTSIRMKHKTFPTRNNVRELAPASVDEHAGRRTSRPISHISAT